ncbi:MAG: ABC transporter permease [Christensenellales bacterium]
MKIFRLVNAELRKIFLRPTIFIMIALLVLCSFISLIAFNPDKRTTDSSINAEGATVSAIYNNFMQTSSSTTHTTKFDLDNKLDAALSSVYSFTQTDDALIELTNIAGENQTAQLDYHNLIIALENAVRPAGRPESVCYQQANLCLKSFHDSLSATIIAFGNLNNSNRYYLTKSEFNEVNEKLKKLDSAVIVYTTLQTKKVYENILTSVRSFEFDTLMTNFINNITEIKIGEPKYEEIKQNYYTSAKNVLGDKLEENSLMGKIEKYYLEHASEGSQEACEEFVNLLADYKAYVNMSCENLNCAIQLEVASGISDKTMQSYIGYGDFNKLTISSLLKKNSYMIDNNINPRTTLEAMNFGVNSGDETNAWDFICFSMNITVLLIIVFCVLICSKIIAGEQAGGTMKMLAIRPFTRNKILGAKLLATMFFSMIFVVFSFIVSFGIGWAFFGLPNQMMIGVFNGSNVIFSHPLLYCFFLILSLFLKVFIYVSIATMISVLFRSYTGSSMISFAIVIITLILNGVLGTKSYFKYFPMANFDIYKYFTSAQTASGFKAIFSSPQIIDTSFTFTFTYAIIMLVVLNAISFLAFNKKDIA